MGVSRSNRTHNRHDFSHIGRRLVGLAIGPAYLFFVANGLADLTGASRPTTLACVFAGAVIIMLALGYIGMRLFERNEGIARFSLASIMVAMAPLAVYLAAIRVVTSQSNELRQIAPGWAWLYVVGCSGSFMFFSTIVLLIFADALTWLAVAMLRLFRRLHRSTT